MVGVWGWLGSRGGGDLGMGGQGVVEGLSCGGGHGVVGVKGVVGSKGGGQDG